MKSKTLMALVLTMGLFQLPAMAADTGTAQDANSQTQAAANTTPTNHLTEEIRKDLVTLPYYSVFDHLAFTLQGSHVTLEGEVTTPVLKNDAGNSVKEIKGVSGVTNNIKVLPLSPMDNQLRRRLYWAIYSYPGMEWYAIQAVPPIHIIVDNGNVTLYGVVRNKADKETVGILAKEVPNVFSVKNDLRVQP